MKSNACLFAALCLFSPTLLHAESCVGLRDFQKSIGAGAESAAGAGKSRIDCSSMTSIWNKIASRNRTGGRKLEGDKPLDMAAAKADLDTALRDSTVRTRIDQLAKETPDQKMRLFYEAAILDEEGFYGARELRIQELQQILK